METTSKHTPGPWHVDGDNVFGQCENWFGYLICEPLGGTPEQAQANAALIAAAPDLLATLEEIVDCHAALTRQVGHNDDTAVCLVAARAAIAKAKGGA